MTMKVVQTSQSVSSTASDLLPENLARRAISFQNRGPNTVYLGVDQDADVSAGFPVLAGQTWQPPYTVPQRISGICAATETALVIVIEWQ